MSAQDSRPDPQSSGDTPGSGAADEARFLARLLDQLAEEDTEAYEALLGADPEVVALAGRAGDVRDRLRRTLDASTPSGRTAQGDRIVEQVRVELAACRAAADQPMTTKPSAKPPAEPPGILSDLTRRLPPEKALELYRKIAPVFVYQLLGRIDQRAGLDVVQRLVEHLCRDEVQTRLRSSEHVRDAILEEFAAELQLATPELQLSRDDLQDLLTESGAMPELVAMENCIRLAASRAG